MSSKPLRTFSPVVIFHDTAILSTNILQHNAKISDYKEKVIQMMERNAKLWSMENGVDVDVSPSTSTTSTATTNSSVSSSASTCDSIETIDTIQDIHHGHQYQQQTIDSVTGPPYPTLLYTAACHSDDKSTNMSTPPPPLSLSSSCSSPTLHTPGLSSLSSTATLSSPPPLTVSATKKSGAGSNEQKKRRRGNLPKEVTEFLKRWLVQHKKHPYPSEKEKIDLAHQTGLTVNQISNWFINARRRILQPMLESEGIQAHLLSYSFAPSITAATDDHAMRQHHHHLCQSTFHHQQQQQHSAFSTSPVSSLSSPTSSSSVTCPSLSPSSSISLMEQKKRRQLDIYAYQGFAESYSDDTRRWAFRRTKLPSFDMDDYHSVAIR